LTGSAGIVGVDTAVVALLAALLPGSWERRAYCGFSYVSH
jgi:hypothetical protein